MSPFNQAAQARMVVNICPRLAFMQALVVVVAASIPAERLVALAVCMVVAVDQDAARAVHRASLF